MTILRNSAYNDVEQQMTKPFRSLRGSLRVSPSFSKNEMKTASDIPWLVKAQSYIGIKGATDLKINPLVVNSSEKPRKKETILMNRI